LVKRLDMPLEVARWAEAYGGFLLGIGRAKDGAARLSEALETYEKIGAVPYAARARAALAHLGPSGAGAAGGSPVAARPGLNLSAAETMVAHLVAAGRSNKQIAAELVVSVKTIEYHISNIYRRLGISSRVKLAQLVGAEL
jgi:DNA-binding NarL/FixJ family response regulator